MATITIDLKDDELLDWATYITEAYGTDAPKDVDDACAIIFDAIMADRKRLTEYTLDKRERAAAADAIKARVDAVIVPPTRIKY
jgi:hypothetical protein